jgi:hypothetical protein
MMTPHFPSKGFFRWVWLARVRRVDSRQQFSTLLALNEFFQREYKQATARNLHAAREIFRLVK